jgi:hypothetical protein
MPCPDALIFSHFPVGVHVREEKNRAKSRHYVSSGSLNALPVSFRSCHLDEERREKTSRAPHRRVPLAAQQITINQVVKARPICSVKIN